MISERMASAAPEAVLQQKARVRSLSIAGEDRPLAARTTSNTGRALLIGVVVLQALLIGWLALGRAPGEGTRTTEDKSFTAGAAAPDASIEARPGSGRATPLDARIKFEAQGFIVATRRATVSTRVAGIVTSIPVEVGDRVQTGQVLGTLDADLAQRELLLAQKQVIALDARVKSAGATHRQALADLAREQSLLDQRFSSQARVLEKQTAVDVAAAALDLARADSAVAELQVQQQRRLLSDYTIRAPFPGVVIEKNAQPGELIAPSGAGGGFTRTGLCTIVDIDSLEVHVDVSEQLVSRVRPGQPVEFNLYAGEDRLLRGVVRRVLSSADRAKGTLQVRVTILDKDPWILPDMRVRLSFL